MPDAFRLGLSRRDAMRYLICGSVGIASTLTTALKSRSNLLSARGPARVSLDDFVTDRTGRIDQSDKIQHALDVAHARNTTVFGAKGAVYRLDRSVILPDGARFAGQGCTLATARHITMFEQVGRAAIYETRFQGPGQGYNSGGRGIRCAGRTGDASPSSVKDYIEESVYEGLSFDGIGNICMDLRYMRGVRARDISVSNVGCSGIAAFSVEDFDGVGFTGDTFFGEEESGELNAYAISFSSQVGSLDLSVDRPSRRCYFRDGFVKNLPTWHALDTHGGQQIGFSDFDLRDVRRAGAITHLGTASARACYFRNIRSYNNLPFSIRDSFHPERPSPSFNSNGTLKRDSAIWVIGASPFYPATDIEVSGVVSRGHGRPGHPDGAFHLLNCSGTMTHCSDEDSWVSGIHVAGGFVGTIAGHRCINLQSFEGAANTVVRPLDSRGGDFTADIEYIRTRALPTGVTDLDAIVAGAGPTNRVRLKGNATWGNQRSRTYVTGNDDAVTLI